MSSEELGFGTDPNSPGDGGGPRRRDRPRTAVLVVGAVTAVLVGLGLGALIASWRGGTPDASPTGASASSTLPSASATSVSPTAPRTTAPSKSPARTVTKSPTATHIPAPTGFVDAPWTTSGSDFGFLRSAGLLSGGQVRVTFDRAQWLTGKAYDDYVKAHGAPDNDYVIVNTSKRLRTFVLPKGAPLSGSAILLGGGSDHQAMTPAAFVAAVNKSAGIGAGVPAWLFHSTSDLESRATAAQEQYLP